MGFKTIIPPNVVTGSTVNIVSKGATTSGDCTTAVQAAADQIQTNGGGTLIYPAGTWTHGSITIHPNTEIFLSPGAVLTPASPSAEMFVIDGTGEPIHFFAMRGAGQITGSADRPYNVPIIHLRNQLNWRITVNLNYTGTGTFIGCEGSYNGTFDQGEWRSGRYMVPLLVYQGSTGQQMDSIRCAGTVHVGTFGPMVANCLGGMHNFELIGWKGVIGSGSNNEPNTIAGTWDGISTTIPLTGALAHGHTTGDVAAAAVVESSVSSGVLTLGTAAQTTLANSPAAGATSIQVASVPVGMAIGQRIVIGQQGQDRIVTQQETTLSGAVAAGATSVSVASVPNGLKAGDPIAIISMQATGDTLDPNKIDPSWNGTSTTIPLVQPLQYAHNAGDPLWAHGFPMFVGNNVQTLSSWGHHFEGYPCGVLVGKIDGIDWGPGFMTSAAILRLVDAPQNINVTGMQRMDGLANSVPGLNSIIEMPSWLVTQAVAGGLSGWAAGSPPTTPIQRISISSPFRSNISASPAAVFSPTSSFSNISYDVPLGGNTMQVIRNEPSSANALEARRVQGATRSVLYVTGKRTRGTGNLVDDIVTGSPEGSVTAPVGSTLARTDGSPTTGILYKKAVGSGNTGWVPDYVYDKDDAQPGMEFPSGYGWGKTNLLLVANNAVFSRFVPSRQITLALFAYVVSTAATANDNVDVGIFDSSLSSLITSGATAGKLNATGVQTISLVYTLLPGVVYYAGLACGPVGGTAATIQGANLNSSNNSQLYGTTVPKAKLASKASSYPLPTAGNPVSSPGTLLAVSVWGAVRES